MTPPALRCTPFSALPRLAQANILVACLAAAALSRLLLSLWLHDDDMTHGLFLPVLTGILLAESRRDPRPRFLRPGPAWFTACLGLVFGALAAFVIAAVYAMALGWDQDMVEFLLAFALVCVGGAVWLGLADERIGYLPFNGAAALGIGLWLFAAPLPPGLYGRLTAGLQGGVTAGVVRVLEIFGVAAYRNGNVIELARVSVGVTEACSGVRSLVSCAVAGLFLAALLLRRPGRRILLVAVAPAIGLTMNFLRSLLLTLLVNARVDIGGPWHDLTGVAILGGTTVLLTLLALGLRRGEAPVEAAAPPASAVAAGRSPLPWIAFSGWIALAAAGGYLAWIGEPRPLLPDRVPDLAALFPAPPPGWTAKAVEDLDLYGDTLQTHALMERVYSPVGGRPSDHLTLYVAYWRPGEAPVSLVDTHTPDLCWPGTGWEPKPLPKGRAVLKIDGRPLAPAECRRFTREANETRVWYWHLYGGRPLAVVDPYSAVRLFQLTLRYGFVRARDQLYIQVSSNRDWAEIASQPTLRQFFSRLKPLGL